MEQIFKSKKEVYLTSLYFLTVLLSAFINQKSFPFLWESVSLARIPLLVLLYIVISNKRDIIYLFALLFFFSTQLLFKNHLPSWAGFTSLIFRLLTFVIVFRSFENKNWFALFLASIPFLTLYLSILVFVQDYLENDIYYWLLNGFLTSLIGGMAVYNYIFENENKNFWLLLSAILFIIQIGFFFINHFYLPEKILVQITIILFGVSNFTFYKFVIVNESKERVLLT